MEFLEINNFVRELQHSSVDYLTITAQHIKKYSEYSKYRSICPYSIHLSYIGMQEQKTSEMWCMCESRCGVFFLFFLSKKSERKKFPWGCRFGFGSPMSCHSLQTDSLWQKLMEASASFEISTKKSLSPSINLTNYRTPSEFQSVGQWGEENVNQHDKLIHYVCIRADWLGDFEIWECTLFLTLVLFYWFL